MTDFTPDVSIIIISFNTKEMTIACIRSIIKETCGHRYEIYVVDNNSSDGSSDLIEKEFPHVRLIKNYDNIGFAAANNLAARHAKGNRLLLINPDTLILEGAVDKILSFADKSPDARLWGGKAIFPDGSVNATCWNDMTIWSCLCRAIGLTWLFPKTRLFNPEAIHSWDKLDKERNVDIIVGCFLLIDKSIWEMLGGFNKAFFMYGDEVDLCIRARKIGALPRFTPEAKIIHYGGASETSSEEKLIKVFRGRSTVMKVHWYPFMASLGQWLLVAASGLRAFGSVIIRPPRRQGGGMDQQSNVWPAVFRRRKEWFRGWDTTT